MSYEHLSDQKLIHNIVMAELDAADMRDAGCGLERVRRRDAATLRRELDRRAAAAKAQGRTIVG